MSAQRRFAAAATIVLGVILAPDAVAQSAYNVAIVVNEASEDSRTVAAHYARVRGVPESNIIRINTSTDEAIDRTTYVETIERPLGQAISRAGLQDRLLYLVLTKGIPLRITGTVGTAGTAASVDSELTLLYRRLTGTAAPPSGLIDNPYFLGARNLSEAKPFSHREHDIYLVTRLDGFTTADALALIDRAPRARPAGIVVLDQRAAPESSRIGDEWMARAAERLAADGHKHRVVLETTTSGAAADAPVLGLFTWGPLDPAYRRRRSGLTFVPGAIAANLASFDARTFREPPADWQPTGSTDRTTWFEGSADALIGDLIRDGVTGVAGQVGEAFLRGAVRPDILFPAYLAGFNLAEAFYLAMPALSWQTVVVGDPLTMLVQNRQLTSDGIDDQLDPATGLPAFFSERRIAAVAAANRDVPRASIVPMVRAIGLLERGDKSAAAQALTEAVEAAPRPANWLTTLGELQQQADDHTGALKTYQRALKIRPDTLIALNNVAYVLALVLEKPAEAKPYAERAVALAPRSGAILDTLAWIEHLLGNDERAAQLLDDAVRLTPKQAEIRLHAAIVYAGLNRWNEADVQLAEALRLDSTFEHRKEVQALRKRIVP